jgi:hypothetical protein
MNNTACSTNLKLSGGVPKHFISVPARATGTATGTATATATATME